MQRAAILASLWLGAALLMPAQAVQFIGAAPGPSPVFKVVGLLQELKARIETDGTSEQESYDKYACWCETTLAEKANEITSGKALIEAEQLEITKLKGDLAAHGAEIGQLKKDIAKNVEAQKEANEVRSKENGEYTEEKEESEQCIGALEAAVGVLTGAGTRGSFLGTLQEAQLLSVAAGVRRLLVKPIVSHSVSDQDLDMVKRFVDRPEEFVSRSGGMSAAQVSQNPFGDYAPQSGQIQGILKGMYDAFTTDLEKANAEESDKQKAFEELMATKAAELSTLQASLTQHETDDAMKTRMLAESKQTRDDAKATLAADEKFFAETKSACKDKAALWAERLRLRTEELTGINEAISILSEGEDIFQNATTTFVQISAVKRGASGIEAPVVNKAYHQLKALATRFKSMSVAKIAVAVKTGGHFDMVISMIDKMLRLLKQEEQDDIAHRDRCEAQTTKNNNAIEDLNQDIETVNGLIGRLNNDETELKNKIHTLKGDINNTQDEIQNMKDMRLDEQNNFKHALSMDAQAIQLLEDAITALSKFYTNNRIGFAQLQAGAVASAPAPPETTFSGSYGGRSQESGGIVAILTMIKEDLEKEMTTASQEDNAASVGYVKGVQALTETLHSQEKTKTEMDAELAALQRKILSKENYRDGKQTDKAGEMDIRAAVHLDCGWINEEFEDRRTKRKAEVDGLIEAKNFLAGAVADEDAAASVDSR